MQRSRFTNHTPHVPFARRDGIAGSYGRRDRSSTNEAVELFVKFRTFRPYLKKRLSKINKEGRERELRDEVDDIKYYLGVMSDMLADENHGAETLQAFIDRIHEMIRKNPMNDSYTSSYASADENDEDQLDSARSPSPTEIIESLSDTPATARTIPLEREQQFSYFGSLEESLGKRRKPAAPTSGSEWEPKNCDTGETYTRRGSYQDIDMRDESRFKPMSNTIPLGRGSGVTYSRRWDGDSSSLREGFGRGVSHDEPYRDRDERYARDYNNSAFGRDASYSNAPRRESSWGESRNWGTEGRERRLSNHEDDYERSRGGLPQEINNSLNQTRGDSNSRDYGRFENQNFGNYDRRVEPPKTPDDSLFERRYQFERRPPSNSNRNVEASVQIDYNHGGASLAQSWEDDGSPPIGHDKDMRGPGSQPSSVANMYAPNLFDPSQHQQQMFLNQQNMNMNFPINQATVGNFVPNPQMIPGMSGANSMMGINMGIPPNIGIQQNLPPMNAQMLNPIIFPHQQMPNAGSGLLPTPSGSIPNTGFPFRSPPSQLPRITTLPPRTPETYLPSNDPGHMDSTSSSNMMKEISKQKAQQCFSRNAVPRRDNQNVPPPAGPQPSSATMPPPTRTTQESLLATNQMLSDRDPRLNKLNKKGNQTSSTSQNDSHQNVRKNLPTPDRVERVQVSDPRLAFNKNRVDNRERNANSDPRSNSRSREINRDRNSASGDPRSGSRSREESYERNEDVELRTGSRSRDSSYDNNSDPRVSSKGRDGSFDRNNSADPRLGSKNKDDVRNRNSKVNNDDSRNKRLDEVRDRVRSNMPEPKTQKTSKLQEIRRQVEKEGFHVLGRPANKKNTSSFDDAIVVPIEKSPPPRHLSNKDKGNKSRESVKEKNTDNTDINKKSQKGAATGNQKGKANQKKGKDLEKPVTRKGAKQRENKRDRSSSLTESDDVQSEKAAVTKKPVYFRIPKIKRPDPPPPPREPTPPPAVEDSYEEESWEDMDHHQTNTALVDNHTAEETRATPSQNAKGQLTLETENLIKEFIRQSVDSTDAENILGNEEALGLVIQRLKEQVMQICHDEQPAIASTSSISVISEAPVPVEAEADLPIETAPPLEQVEPKDTETRRSRSVTRKKSTKRRSSLEKLHDALKEMRFDTMLPLGPRRCTVNDKESHETSASQSAKSSGQSSKQSKILLNKEDLSQILASTDPSKPGAEKPTELATDTGPGATLSQEDEAISAPVGNKRGRKRKRKGSKMKPNKKKKGPVTRAQAAVKTALKVQQKDKGKPNAGEGKEKFIRTKKLSSRAESSKSEGRVTRSMIGKSSVVSNLGLGKIKLEQDYIPPKAEPDDQELDDCITAGTGYEHLEENNQSNPPVTNFIEMPSFIAEMGDIEDDRMSIDIKSEPDYDELADPIDSFEKNSEEMVADANQEEIHSPEKELDSSQNAPIVVMELQSDTNYDTDLSFLPNLPELDSDISMCKLDHVNNMLKKVTPDPNEFQSREVESSRQGEVDLSTNSSNECENLMDWMLDMVEYETDESAKKTFENQLESLVSPTKENYENVLEKIVEPFECSSDVEVDDFEEPNDYYIIDISDSESDDEEDSSETTDGESESKKKTITTENEMKTEYKHEPLETSDENKPIASEISTLRNNKKSILAVDPYPFKVPDCPIQNSSLIPINRVGDGCNKSILLQGYVSPLTLKMSHEQREAIELKKLALSCEGSRKTTVKSLQFLNEMLTKDKVQHLFKCMGTYCSYSGDSPDQFLEHLKTHEEMENLEEEENTESHVSKNPGCAKFMPYEDTKLIKDWQGCAYCSLNYINPEDLKNHIINQHNLCSYQCTLCFYRSFYQKYIIRHFEVIHPGKEINVVKCKQRCKSEYVEANVFRVFVYKCALSSCKEISKRFIYRSDFVDHLKACSPSSQIYPCHLCQEQFPLDGIIEHYKIHSLFKYHCSYCQFASEEKDDLDVHFLSIHPNVSGRVFTRERRPPEDKEKEMAKDKKSDKEVNPLQLTETEIKKEPTDALPEVDDTFIKDNSTEEKCLSSVVKEELEDNTVKKESGQVESDDEDTVFNEENRRITNLEGASLYKCANQPCHFNAENATLFKDHITTCIFTPDNKQVSCFHCDKRVKAIPNLLEHLKVHGRKKQYCGLCPFKTWVNSELTRHLKTVHKVYNFKMEPGVGDDPDVVVYPKDVASKIITLQTLKESYARFADRMTFSPEDMDKVPSRHIFHTLAYCSSCNYSSKVRVNFIRHLKLHGDAPEQSDNTVPESDPVNPVPCLERKELMFDKMTNWAGSTHAHKPGASIATDSASVPQFVLDQFRYVCSVAGCGQITTDEHMLRTHMRALHSETDIYQCPHCYKNELTKDDPRNSVLVDKLGNHLKLHGSKLYRCAYCDFISPQTTPMEKHLPEKHPEKKPIHYLIRNLDADGQSSNRRISSDENGSAEKWRCAICISKSLFNSYDEVKQHCQTAHRIGGQFVCANCKYYTDSDTAMRSHVLEDCEQKSSPDGRILVLWIRNELNDILKPDDVFFGPLWKRTTQNVKHIRGIFLEDVKERASKADGSSSAKASSAASNSSGGSNISGKGSEKGTGKKSGAKSLDPNSKLSQAGPSAKTPKAQEQSNAVKSPALMVCPKCNRYKTKNRRDMTVHLYNELSYQRYKCTKCTLKFVTENSLKGHYSGDHGLTYNENSCEMLPVDVEVETYVENYFDEQDLLQKASEEVEKPIVSQLSCKHCFQEFASAHNLRTHVLAKHLATERYRCKYCPVTFWCKTLARAHIIKTHKDSAFAVIENIDLKDKLTPEFWRDEYGIPTKSDQKKAAVKKDLFKTKSKDVERTLVRHQCSQCNFCTDDASTLEAHIEEYHSEDDIVLGSESVFKNGDSNDGLETIETESSHSDPKDLMNFVDELGESELSPFPSTSKAPAHKQENANLYKCFHCKDNFFTVRGVRSHWKRSHSKRPEERCNYYEYKAFNESMELPPWMELCCCHCDYKVSSMILMKNHHSSAHKGLPYRMKRRTRNGNDVFSCNHCFHESTHISDLQEHTDQFHPGFQLAYSNIDIQNREKSEDHSCYGKLIEDTVRYPCAVCDVDFDSQLECKRHVSMHGIAQVKDAGMKFSRQVLNHRIKVPADCETGRPVKQTYKCPVCDFRTEDRDKLVWEHLSNHIYAYTCPECKKDFRTFVETKFHIRHDHAKPNEIPLYSEEIFKARELLMKDLVPESEATQSNNMVKKFKKPPVVFKPPVLVPKVKCYKRRSSMPNTLSQKPETESKLTDDDDDIIIDDVIIINPPSGSRNFAKVYNAGNKHLRRSTEDSSMQNTLNPGNSSDSLSEETSTSNRWPCFENFSDFNKIEPQVINDVDDEPEIVEIPSTSEAQWSLDNISGFPQVDEENPFISTSSLTWEEWDGKS